MKARALSCQEAKQRGRGASDRGRSSWVTQRSHPSPYLRRVWHEAAVTRLTEAFEECFGGTPDGVHVQARVERGDPGQVLVDVADQPGDAA